VRVPKLSKDIDRRRVWEVKELIAMEIRDEDEDERRRPLLSDPSGGSGMTPVSGGGSMG